MTLEPLYDWYLNADGTLTRWMRNSVVGPSTPDAPTDANASITGTTATITWAPPASDGGSAITGYTVTRVGGSTHNLSATARSDTFTGLTTGQTYSFTVAAVNDVGTGPAITVSASSSNVTTIWGINNNQGYSHMTIAARENWYSGRMPVIRTYASNWTTSTPTYNINTPEGRDAYSWKAGGLYSAHQLADGTAHGAMVHFLESIPAGEQVWWGHHHEVNNGTLQSNGTYMEVLPADYLGIYHQMRLAQQSAHLASGVEVIICCNFMFQDGLSDSSPKWDDAWVPPLADCDCFTIDLYGNPSPNATPNKYGGPPPGSAGKGYDSVYPLISNRLAFAFKVIERTGFKDSWGIWEFDSPQRNWDKPTTQSGGTSPSQEAGRILWHKDYINSILSPPMTGHTPARIALLWEAPEPPASSWDQTYGRLDGDSSRMVALTKPYITGTPIRR